MKTTLLKSIALVSSLTLSSCDNPDDNPNAGLNKLVIGTNITTSNPVIGYVGTHRDLTESNFTNTRSRQFAQYPYVTVYKNDVFVMPSISGDDVIHKYTRKDDGSLAEAGSITAPPASAPLATVVESDTKAYCSLYKSGKILVFNPASMQSITTIDLTSYALGGDGNPDPSIMALRNGKLYVACTQTSNGFTSDHPVQILIIDLNNNYAVTSATDSRSTWAGSINEQQSIFFDESGDLYIFCVASYGFGGSDQKSGFLRIKNSETTFDATYFFNVSDLSIDGIPNNKVDYLQKMRYAGGGIVYSTGNIYSLASNPPDYVEDKTYGSFKVNLINKTIEKLNVPYSNGYAASVCLFDGKVLFGISGASGVGIYTFDPATSQVSTSPVVNTQGDPHVIETF
jgi:hypothetical protein